VNQCAWQVQSLLLSYPDDALFDRIPLLRNVAARLPDPIGSPLTRFLSYAGSTSVIRLATEYVATFDHHRKFSPYLTYFTEGDTRKRGLALLRIKRAYRAAGLELGTGELPDHLAVVLEFAATVGSDAGQRLLIAHRAGLELLRLGLREADSPWADVLDSVSATLPPLAGHDHDAVARLAAAGPPDESVGLEPYELTGGPR
jgi:nitrate reductase molybdenum cofactor assembly chaperone NarJ/NarW